MLVAALYDIHGNVPALQAVLEEIHQTDVDGLVIGGDMVPGPMPRETLECLLDLDIPVRFICGNGEVAVLDEIAGRTSSKVPEQHRPIISWTAQQFDSAHERLLSSWPKTLSLEIPGLGNVLFCHATPRDENECFTRETPAHRLLPIFQALDRSVVVCGHTHMQFDRIVGRVRVVNAGSVGMPFGNPGAYWLLLGPDVQLRYTQYDLVKASQLVKETSYPQAQDFANDSILRPPSEAKMIELFARAELK